MEVRIIELLEDTHAWIEVHTPNGVLTFRIDAVDIWEEGKSHIFIRREDDEGTIDSRDFTI